MRVVGWLIPALWLTSACGSGSTSDAAYPKQEVPPAANLVAPEAAAGNLQNVVQPEAADAGPVPSPDDPGAEGMSPNQRRAYDRGFRDCRAGRYEPDRYSEAYRIGCAAAQDR